MTPAKRDSPPQEKTPTAEPKPQAGGGGGQVQSTDWREQSEPHPAPPGTGAAPTKPAKAAAPAPRAGGTSPRPPPPASPYAAGKVITVTRYDAPGKASFFQVGTEVVGSEEAAAMALKNILFLPSVPAQP